MSLTATGVFDLFSRITIYTCRVLKKKNTKTSVCMVSFVFMIYQLYSENVYIEYINVHF